LPYFAYDKQAGYHADIVFARPFRGAGVHHGVIQFSESTVIACDYFFTVHAGGAGQSRVAFYDTPGAKKGSGKGRGASQDDRPVARNKTPPFYGGGFPFQEPFLFFFLFLPLPFRKEAVI
jgi:hypothetical protein